MEKNMRVKEKREKVAPKVGAILFNHILITTDYEGQESSNIILLKENKARIFKEIQTVVATGPMVPEELIKPGDRVLLDIDRMRAKRANGGDTRLIQLHFNRYTGEMLTSDNQNDEDMKDDADIDTYVLVSDREVLMRLG